MEAAAEKTAKKPAPAGSRSPLRLAAGIAAITTGALSAVLWLGILAGSEVRHTAGPAADVALWVLLIGALAALAVGILLVRASRGRGGPLPSVVGVSAVLVLAGALIESSLGVFDFGSAGGIILAVLLAATLALTGLVLVSERTGALPRTA